MQAMKEAQERRMKMERTGHGCLNEIGEKEFLPEVAAAETRRGALLSSRV